MGDRLAQEFWDQMWHWEKYERFPAEQVDDPHLVVELAAAIEQAGPNPDPELFARYDQCVGRVLNRLTNLFPRSGELLDEAELKHWLAFGLRSDVRGHDAAVTPIIDANSLVIFRFFVRHALEYCERHALAELKSFWTTVANIATQVDEEHQGTPSPSRFGDVS
jgi:hypothetical protein